jgi:uncharacterized protein
MNVGRDDMNVGRDRDEAGRPRNARPRDPYGRPLPRGTAGEPTVPEDVVLSPAETVAEAERLLDADRPFHAHEVLEAAWKSGPPDERDLWQGLAQIAVGLTHARRGNARGAIALLERGADRISRFASEDAGGRTTYGIDVTGMRTYARTLAARIRDEGLDALAGDALRPRLTAPARPDDRALQDAPGDGGERR